MRLIPACRRAARLLTPLFSELGHARPIGVLEQQFRLNSVWTGAWATVIICAPALVYAVTDGGRSDHTAFLVTWIVALMSGFGAFMLPWRQIMTSRWRELAFLSWTLLDLLVITVATISDGGPNSPVTGLFFAPIVFVGASYPTASVKLVCAIGLAGYAALALAFGQPFGRAVLVLGGLGGAALISWWQAQNHEFRRRQLDLAAVTDPLTGALNRRGLDAAAVAEIARVQRAGTPVALMIIDLDDFKGYNDANGHVRGDELLRWIAQEIRSILRPTDTLARIGGDEFAVLMSGTDADGARPVAQRIHSACREAAPHCVGISSAPDDGDNFDSLYRAADRRLYEAKHGRARRPPAEASSEAGGRPRAA